MIQKELIEHIVRQELKAIKEEHLIQENILDDIVSAWQNLKVPGSVEKFIEKSGPTDDKIDNWFRDNMSNPGVRWLYKALMAVGPHTPDHYRHDKQWQKQQQSQK